VKSLASLLAMFAYLLLPTLLLAQTDSLQELPLPPVSPWLLQLAANTPAASSPKPCNCGHRARLYASARKKPLTPRDVQMREAVQSLGVDKHRFVHCRLKDGSHLVGGITSIQQGNFVISQGIWGSRGIRYSDLQEEPRPVAAVGEHLENGLKWTGLATVCVALSPLLIPLIPLVYAGVIQD